MGCGVSKESAAEVLGNTVTHNGNAHGKSKSNGATNGNAVNGGIDLQDPELEEAATRIQATYRGYASRKTVKMSNPAEEEVDIDLTDPDVASAANKIQASFRGHQFRRQQEKAEKAKADAELTEQMEKLKTTTTEEEEELPDLSDPELNKAATKIQAQFKGHMVRKTKKDEPSSK